MSEETEVTEVTEVLQDELTLLKGRAKQLGISFHPNIGLEKLKAKVNAKLNPDLEEKPEETEPSDAPVVAQETATKQNPGKLPEESRLQRHSRLRKEASRLIRIRISCMNPNKKEWEGEVFTVSNSVIGTFKKFVPFDNDEGWHVPKVIFNMIKERKCQIFQTKKNDRGVKMRVGKLINEFAIEILNPLDQKDLDNLAKKQALANNIG